jgi:hypothetical protein
MSTIILIWLMRILEVVFFVGVAGCLVTIVVSWYSIFKDEFTSDVRNGSNSPRELPIRKSTS